METFSDARLNMIAMNLGMEAAIFGKSLSSSKYTRQVSDDYDAARAVGNSGTPIVVLETRT